MKNKQKNMNWFPKMMRIKALLYIDKIDIYLSLNG